MKKPKSIFYSFFCNPIVILFLVGIFVRILILIFFKNGELLTNKIITPLADQKEYLGLAINLIKGEGFYLKDLGFTEFGKPYVYRPPFYPLVLGMLYVISFHHLGIVRVLQLLITLAFIPLSVNFFKLFSSKKAYHFIVGLIITLNPFLVYSATILLPDWLFYLLFSIGIYYFIKMSFSPQNKKVFILAGLFLSFASLTRGEAWYTTWLIAAIYIVLNFKSIKIRYIACFLFAFLLPISVWTIRNFVHYREFIPIQRGTITLATVEGFSPVAAVVGWPDYKKWENRVLREREKLPEIEREPYLFREIKKYYMENPGYLAKSIIVKTAYMCKLVPLKNSQTPYQSRIYALLSIIGFAIFIPFFVIGFFILSRFYRKIAVYFGAIFIANFSIGVITHPDIRIRTQIHFLFLIVSCVGIFFLVEKYLVETVRRRD